MTGACLQRRGGHLSRNGREQPMRGQAYDVIVIGARVAGATLTALLGDAGVRVLLVDRVCFPSTTLSTHYFRGAGLLAVLSRLGILDRILALGAPPLLHCYYYSEGTDLPTVGPPQEPGALGYSLSVRREPLDALLLQHASSCPSVDFVERTHLAGLLWEGGRVVGARLVTPEGTREVRARIVVGADGRHSVVARAVAAPAEEEAPACRALYYRYVRGVAGPGGSSPDGAEFSQRGDELAYIFPSDAGVTCVALSLNLTAFAGCGTRQSSAFTSSLPITRVWLIGWQQPYLTVRYLVADPIPIICASQLEQDGLWWGTPECIKIRGVAWAWTWQASMQHS